MEKKTTRVLLTHRFFYPDSPTYGYIVENMREVLLEVGYKVDVLSSKPSYKAEDKKKKLPFIEKKQNKSTIYRLPVFKLSNNRLEKLLNYFWFPLAAFFFQIFSKRYDIVTVATTPAVLYAFLVALSTKLRKRKLIYHMMDIHPEIGKLSGEFSNKYIFNILMWMDNFTCKVSSKIIVLSEDMKKVIIKRNPEFIHKIEIINNYDVGSKKRVTNKDFFEDEKTVKVVFTGNLGRFQNLESFIFALREYGCPNNFQLIFVGEGTALQNLKQLAKPLNTCIKFVPHQPMAIAKEIIAEADMGIVSLEKEIINYAYPSKTMSYLSEGTPLLVCIDDGSELSNFVESENIGISVEPSDLYTIHSIFEKLSNNKDLFDRVHIKRVFERYFSKNIFDTKILTLIKHIEERS